MDNADACVVKAFDAFLVKCPKFIRFGCSWLPLWKNFQASGGVLSALRAVLARLGGLLDRLGGILRPLGAVLAHLGGFLGRLGSLHALEALEALHRGPGGGDAEATPGLSGRAAYPPPRLAVNFSIF